MNLIIGNKNYSSWSLRPWIVMTAKDIAFEETLVQLRAVDTPARIRQFSPSSKVPCLVDGDVAVWESLSIMEYLAEKFPDKGIWPADAKARAHARSISSEMHAGFQPLRMACPMSITQRFAPKPLADDVKANVARIAEIWGEARGRHADKAAGPFLYGAFSAADGMYAPVVSRFHSYGIAPDETSTAYMDAVRAHPAYRAWLAAATEETWVIQQNEADTPIEDLRRKA